MQRIKLSTPKQIPFTAVSSANLQLRLQVSVLSLAARVVKYGGTTVAGGGTFSARDESNQYGQADYLPLAAELNTTGPTRFIFSASGMEPREVVVDVVPFDPYRIVTSASAIAGTLNATSFSTDLTETTTDHWKDAFVRFTSGVLIGQTKLVTAYNGTTRVLTTDAFTGAPSAADTFEMINA